MTTLEAPVNTPPGSTPEVDILQDELFANIGLGGETPPVEEKPAGELDISQDELFANIGLGGETPPVEEKPAGELDISQDELFAALGLPDKPVAPVEEKPADNVEAQMEEVGKGVKGWLKEFGRSAREKIGRATATKPGKMAVEFVKNKKHLLTQGVILGTSMAVGAGLIDVPLANEFIHNFYDPRVRIGLAAMAISLPYLEGILPREGRFPKLVRGARIVAWHALLAQMTIPIGTTLGAGAREGFDSIMAHLRPQTDVPPQPYQVTPGSEGGGTGGIHVPKPDVTTKHEPISSDAARRLVGAQETTTTVRPPVGREDLGRHAPPPHDFHRVVTDVTAGDKTEKPIEDDFFHLRGAATARGEPVVPDQVTPGDIGEPKESIVEPPKPPEVPPQGPIIPGKGAELGQPTPVSPLPEHVSVLERIPDKGGIEITTYGYEVQPDDTATEILAKLFPGEDPYGTRLTRFVHDNADLLRSKGKGIAKLVDKVLEYPDWVARGGKTKVYETLTGAARLIHPGDILRFTISGGK